MAEAIITGGIRPVTLPNHFPPMPAVARILSRFDRRELHGFIAVAIDLADAMDGDSDFEGQCNEDEISRCTDLGFGVGYRGPGCEIADDGGCEHDGREPDTDAEVETWAHWMDHSPELHVGKRPGHTD
jgi:hypothetical protein